MSWFRIAARQGKSLSEAMQTTSATEFVDWNTFLELEYNEPSRTDYYLIQLTYQVYLLQFILGGEPKQKPDDFKIKFDFDAAREKILASLKEQTEEELEEQAQARVDYTKLWWDKMMGGMGGRKKPKEGGKEEKIQTRMPPKLGPVANAPQRSTKKV